MSGTSADGIDAALVDFSAQTATLVAHNFLAFPTALRNQILAAADARNDRVSIVASLDAQLGELIGQQCLELLKQTSLNKNQISAIGNHGHTIRHAPELTPAYSVQIGDPNRIAQLTGITTVADFRRADMAAGGQGAPLASGFHRAVLRSKKNDRFILNIGGMANLTYLPADPKTQLMGFDTGPGNVLMDAWCELHTKQRYDHNGKWASTGKVDHNLLSDLLSDEYFALPPPKSTGREKFSLDWLKEKLSSFATLPTQDVQACLCELTAMSITQAISGLTSDSAEILVCGGGIHNQHLLARLVALNPNKTVASTGIHGVDPDWMEAMAFAWLAKQTLAGLPGNVPEVTGAKREVVLGGIYPA